MALGGRVIYRMIRDRIHFHTHRHAAGDVHFHAHSHAGDVKDHALSRHGHAHPAGGWKRSLAIGMMHGLAGSAALWGYRDGDYGLNNPVFPMAPSAGIAAAVATLAALLRLLPERDPQVELFEMADAIALEIGRASCRERV